MLKRGGKGTDEWLPTGTAHHFPDYFPDYDPLGRMLQAPDGPMRFGFDGDNVVRTNIDSAANQWTFVHGPGLDDPLMAHFVIISGAGSILVQQTAYFATDGQGRQYGVGDAQGRDQTADDNYFTAWGGEYAGGTRDAAGYGADRSSPASMKQLSFFRHRFYDQQTGRWTQEDPIGVAGGVNLYQFNGNNPVTNTDPFGLCPCLLPLVGGLTASDALAVAGTALVTGIVLSARDKIEAITGKVVKAVTELVAATATAISIKTGEKPPKPPQKQEQPPAPVPVKRPPEGSGGEPPVGPVRVDPDGTPRIEIRPNP